jgi:hypothetical protein
MFDEMAAGIFNQSELEETPKKKKHGVAAFNDSFNCKYCGYTEICAQSFQYSENESEEAFSVEGDEE